MIRVFATVLTWLALSLGASAHVPHDVVHDIAVHGETVAATVRGEHYLSGDGGRSWRRLRRGITCAASVEAARYTVAFSPPDRAERQLFLTCGNALFVSRDDGARFALLGVLGQYEAERLLVVPRGAADLGFLVIDTEARLLVSPDGGRWRQVDDIGRVTAIARAGDAIYAGTGTGRLHVSRDGGESWREIGALPSGDAITAIVSIEPGAASPKLVLGTASSGVTWMALREDGPAVIATALPGRHITSLAYRTPEAATGPGLLLATAWHGGVFRSDDGGLDWTPINQDLQRAEQAIRHGEASFVEIGIIGPDRFVAATFTGIYVTDDGGAEWARIDTTYGNIIAVEAWAEDGRMRLAALLYGAGIVVSEDGGQSWKAAHTGLIHVRRHSLAAVPTDGGATLMSGSMRSFSLRGPWAARWRNVDILAVPEPETAPPGPQVIAPVAIAPSPAFPKDGVVFLGMHPRGILRSRDQGGNFAPVFSRDAEVTALAISPAFADDGTIFAAAGPSVFVSKDGGDSWAEALAVGQAPVLLAISPDFGRDGTVLALSRDTLWLSRDGGRAWSVLHAMAKLRFPEAIAVSPAFAQDSRVFLQQRGEPLRVGTLDGDAIAWQEARLPSPVHEVSQLPAIEAPNLFAFSPDYAEDRTVFAAGGERMLRSTDGGLVWEALPPLPLRYEAEYARTDWFHVPIVADGAWELYPWDRSMMSRITDRLWRIAHGTGASGASLGGNAKSLQTIRSGQAGATLTFDFFGTGVTWVGSRGPDHGMSAVSVDGGPAVAIDQYAERFDDQQEIFSIDDLPNGLHRLQILVSGDARAASWGSLVSVDAFDVRRSDD